MFSEEIIMYTLAGAILLSFLAFVWALFLHLKIKKLLRGTNTDNLERHLANISRDYDLSKVEFEKLAEEAKKLAEETKKSVRGVGLEKFHPFAGSGDSKPSFALAFLNDYGDGIIISTLHARHGFTMFSKEVKKFVPSGEFTQEEKNALERARNSLYN